jgi:hypothetical protein
LYVFNPIYRCQIPCILSVDRKELFSVATRKLGFIVEAEETLPIGDEFVTVIEVANIWARASLQKETKKFYGEFASTDMLSVQSAYHVALSYLEKEKLVIIDDYNSEYIMQLRSDLFRFRSWAMLHELDAASLRERARTVAVALRGLLSSVKTMLLSPQSTPAARTSKKARYDAGSSVVGDAAAVHEQHGLSSSVASFEAAVSSLLDASLEKNASVARQPKEEGTSSSAVMQ